MADNRKPIGASLQMTDPDQAALWEFVCDEMRTRGVSQGQVIKEALRVAAYAPMQPQSSVEQIIAYAPEVDLSEVLMRLDILSDQIAQLAMTVNRMSIVGSGAEVVTQTVVDGNTGEQREIEAELVPIDPDDNTPFLRGARNMARPGLRLNEVK